MTDQVVPPPERAPAIDVVICTHNRPDLLRVAVDAVLAQDYAGKVTVVVVFDRSEPDLSLERHDPARRVLVVTNTRTGGLAGARNSGVLAGGSPLVAFCDDDDAWEPDKLTRQVRRLLYTGALTCVTGIRIQYGDHSSVRLARADEMTLERLVRRRVMPAHPSSVLVRREALLGPIGLVDEHIPGSYAEDYDWILRAALAGDICVVEEPLVRVMWGQSLFSGRWRTIIEALDYMVDKFPQFQADRGALARIRGQQAFGHAALGERRRSLGKVWETMRLNPAEPRAWVALPVAVGLVKADTVMGALHRRGHGI
ncbi:glycosyltransferase family 2 protein [Tessaracoccus defluvii]|uniref:glycosyltransferase family 2 protein n=1 Tax=Tessaracoccus defluvii TaxID=1285901 RepID=UPI001D048C18|nr:glycosyltransferase family 2 protein [Tessaracoccus defluvii]